MAERAHRIGNYVAVCAALIVLTIGTVGVSFLPLAGEWHIAIGLGFAILKASLVVLIFMHALRSSRLTWVVISVAGFWLGLLFVLTLTDYLSRGLVPYMPGH